MLRRSLKEVLEEVAGMGGILPGERNKDKIVLKEGVEGCAEIG
jgi:hypothetical protein